MNSIPHVNGAFPAHDELQDLSMETESAGLVITEENGLKIAQAKEPPPRQKATKSDQTERSDTKGVRSPGERAPTHDEMGDELIAKWNGDCAYFREQWNVYANGYWRRESNIDYHLWEALKAHKSQGVTPDRSKAASIEAYVRSRLFVPDDHIDNSTDYINLRNGLYNLTTDTLEAHRRELYLTSQLGFDFDPRAECVEWELFTEEALTTPDGLPDRELIALAQEAVGYSLTADTSYQVSFWLCGESGGGKSTFIRGLKSLMGNAYIDLDLSSLDRNQYQLADIPGKRVVACTEALTNSVLADNIFKMLVSGDEMPVRQIRKETIRFKPVCKIWWAMNEKPRVNDRSKAVYRRVILIPFNHPIPEEQQDRLLTKKLEAEAAGIFNWALEGLRRLNRKGQFTRSAQVDQAREEYRAENDTEAAFVADWCVIATDQSVDATDLYDTYKLWCHRNGHAAKSATKVARDWQRLGFTRERNNRGRFYRGVGLTAEALTAVGFSKS